MVSISSIPKISTFYREHAYAVAAFKKLLGGNTSAKEKRVRKNK